MSKRETINELSINAIRILSADAVQKANSGHPGLPLGAAPAAYELWAHHLNHNPENPKWINRDRFVLSAGHGSMLLYSLLYLFGYGDLGKADLKNFRQLNSLTPGHPEYNHTVGVEATTGPLGAGLGMAVGMAIAEAHLGAEFNRDKFPVYDHYTYVLCGDGCLMEGISSEVMSLAGTLGLGKLIILYDSNSISIEGSTSLAFTEDVEKRFEAFGFQTLSVADGNDIVAIGNAIVAAKAEHTKPSFIKITTTIGYGVPAKAGTASAHGEPLGVENVAILREQLKWPLKEAFEVPDEVWKQYKMLGQNGAVKEETWNKMFTSYREEYPELQSRLRHYYDEISLEDMLSDSDFWQKEAKADATRNIGGKTLNYLKDRYTNIIGGSADLSPSTKTTMKGVASFSKDSYEGRNIHFGVRELGMTAITNGIILHGGLKAYASTFLVFADYMKPMLRLSALMKIPFIAVLTHDSIGVGEDGPTHEPVEQLTMLRAIPNMQVIRPADEVETKAAWSLALSSKDIPTAIILSRQTLPILEHTSKDAIKGGYILEKESNEQLEVIILASGSEVGIAVETKKELENEGIGTRVVSMPCMELFEKQSEEYREMVLPRSVRKRVAVEAGSCIPWGRYIGLDGIYITMDGFGSSAPANQLFEKYGFTVSNIMRSIKKIL